MTYFLRSTVVASVVFFSGICALYNSFKNRANESRRRLTGAWMDPKTTRGKAAPVVGIESLRFVAFGTSKTWGAGLNNPNTEAYIKLLSPNGVNHGLRATFADYPSLCFHSLIGEDMFDVVILEFSPYGGQRYKDFDRLARRARARFPSAIIIYLPIYMLLADVSYQEKHLLDFVLSLGVSSPKDFSVFNRIIRHLTESDMAFPQQDYNLADYERTMVDIGGHVIEFPAVKRDLKSFVIDNVQYYGHEGDRWDFIHPSALGHELIARMIRSKVLELQSKQPFHVNAAVGSWLEGKDRCMSWFADGNVTEDIQRITNMSLANFAPWQGGGKWALEVAPQGGSFSVECLFSHCNIYVSYMSKGPEKDYPRVSLSLSLRDNKITTLDPHDDSTIKLHVRQMVHVGTVSKPGIVTVLIQPQEVTKHGFRITGIITSPTNLGRDVVTLNG